MSPADSDNKKNEAGAEQPAAEAPLPTEPEVPQAPPEPPQAPPPLDFEEHRERRWLMLLVYFLVALAVAVLVVLGGRWAYRSLTHKNKPAPVQPAGDQTPQPPASTPTPSPATPQPSTPQGSDQAAQLPNNGPGDVIALFIGVSIIVAGLHYIVSLRRAD